MMMVILVGTSLEIVHLINKILWWHYLEIKKCKNAENGYFVLKTFELV